MPQHWQFVFDALEPQEGGDESVDDFVGYDSAYSLSISTWMKTLVGPVCPSRTGGVAQRQGRAEDRNEDLSGKATALQDWPSIIVEETGTIRDTTTHTSARGNRKPLENAAGLYNDFLMLL